MRKKKGSSKTKKVSKKNGAKTKVKVQRAKKPTSILDAAPVRLKGNLLLRFRAAVAEYTEARTRANLIALEINQEKKKSIYEVLRKMEIEEHIVMQGVKEKDIVLAKIGQEICKKFNIPKEEFNSWTFNTETGVGMGPDSEDTKKKTAHSLTG